MNNITFCNLYQGFSPEYALGLVYDLLLKKSQTKIIIVGSVFGDIKNILESQADIKILYTRENLDNYKIYKENINQFDAVFGFNDEYPNQLEIPMYYDLFRQYETHYGSIQKEIENNLKKERTKDCCLVSKNPHSLRIKILEKLKNKNISVDCPGLVGKNMDVVLPSQQDKIKFLTNYYFNICPENSYAQGYTTEKLFDCCVAGCIPIYWGYENLNNGIFNKNRILHINKDLSNIDYILDKVTYLLNNKQDLQDMILQKPFGENYPDLIKKTEEKIVNFIDNL